MKKKIIALAAAAAIVVGAFAQTKVDLAGAGATFPAPLYTVMFDAYSKANGVKVNYQAVGSGSGISALISKTVDFGASDAPMTADELKKAGADVTHIPTCIGAIVVAYNLPSLGSVQLKLSGQVIADIYLGNVDKWNDPAIAALNPGVKLPDQGIIVVRRSDSSGTSYNFTAYLTKVSPDWAAEIGVSKNPKWPVGVGGKGNPGVAAYVKQAPGSIGYVEIAYALQNKMAVAKIRNKAGNFIDPNDLDAVAKAGALPTFPADAKADIVDTDAKDGYPIAAMTWLLVYTDLSYTSREKALGTLELIRWMTHEGQKFAKTVNYAPLPPAAVKVVDKLLAGVTYKGEPLLK